MAEKWSIYKHTNLTNGKVYIGSTSRKPEIRWNKGKGYDFPNSVFYRDIQLYGWDGFSHEIIDTAASKEEADILEQKYIAEYHAMDPELGYNQTRGGVGSWGRVVSEESRLKSSKAMKGRYVGEKGTFYGRRHTEEAKKKIGEAHKGKSHPISDETRRKISLSHMGIGHPISEETRKKISEANKGHAVSDELKQRMSKRVSGSGNPMYGRLGSDNPNAKPVIQYDLLGNEMARYSCLKEASEISGIILGSISQCCNSKTQSAGGYIWRFLDDLEINPVQVSDLGRPVYQFKMNGELVRAYKNATEAAETNDLPRHVILNVCKGNAYSAFDSIWSFSNKVTPHKAIQPAARFVKKYTTEGIFVCEYESLAEAARDNKTSISSISSCCKGIGHTANGFIFCYSEDYSEEYIKKRVSEISMGRPGVRIAMMTEDGTVIKEFDSVASAAAEIGVSPAAVYYNCAGKTKLTKGYVFRKIEQHFSK